MDCGNGHLKRQARQIKYDKLISKNNAITEGEEFYEEYLFH